MAQASSLSIVIPAKNESAALGPLLQELRAELPGDTEIVVVDDGSTDDTGAIAAEHGCRVVRHPYSMGNGAAIKSGARAASGDILVCMDADAQHRPADIKRLLAKLDDGFDMAVGARSNETQASAGRLAANRFFNLFAGRLTGHPILDLTSGFRAVKAKLFREFLYLLPNGFSYPTTITMAFFRAGYSVGYVPITAGARQGRKSHIRPFRDGARFVTIIFKVATLYSPLKIFAPASLLIFLTALGYSAYTLGWLGRFTNMSALLFSLSLLAFLIGLLSEQVTTLMYRRD